MTRENDAGRKTRKPQRLVLSDETYETVRNMLLTHEIKPGERVNIDALARRLDVSQTPVREALARLESDGLVVKEPLRGYAATQVLTAKQLDDLFKFRATIEPWMAKSAALNVSEQGAELIKQELERGRSAGTLGVKDAYAAMSEHDARFHELIASESGSEFARDAFVRTHCHLHLFRLYQVLQTWMDESREEAKLVEDLFQMYYEPKGGFLAFREHEAIAAAIIAGKSKEAEQLMRDHIESSRQRFAPTIAGIQSHEALAEK